MVIIEHCLQSITSIPEVSLIVATRLRRSLRSGWTLIILPAIQNKHGLVRALAVSGKN